MVVIVFAIAGIVVGVFIVVSGVSGCNCCTSGGRRHGGSGHCHGGGCCYHGGGCHCHEDGWSHN